MDWNVEQKVEERLGSLELEVESLCALMERHLSSLTSRAPTITDAQSVEFVRETRERVDAVASQLEDVLPHVHAYRGRFHAPVSEAIPSADEERIGRTRRQGRGGLLELLDPVAARFQLGAESSVIACG